MFSDRAKNERHHLNKKLALLGLIRSFSTDWNKVEGHKELDLTHMWLGDSDET